jgi:glycosyltransferase involved in cell wall biosynthesis
MNVLHVFSNHKWTGPAEPALLLCRSLLNQGIHVTFACSTVAPTIHNSVAETADTWGIPRVSGFRLAKHRNPWHNLWDIRKLRRLVREQQYDLVHCHLDNDHLLACSAVADAGVPIVRSSYYGEGFPLKPRYATLLSKTSLLLEPSVRAQENDVSRFQLPQERVHIVPPAVDLQRFDPTRISPALSRSAKYSPGTIVFGIVARLQRHRRYEDLFRAVRILAQRNHAFRLVVVGRGTYQEQVGFTPVREWGLQDYVHFTGYLRGDAYVAALRSFDVGLFLYPGSDGTCRAVREMMALGIPMVVADRGMLPELVTHGKEGLVFDNSVEALVNAMERMILDPVFRAACGHAARKKAVTCFDPVKQAAQVIQLYRNLLNR